MKLKVVAFSLIELLVTVAVISMLISLLIPGVSQAKNKGRKVQCVSNVRQLAIASLIYADEDKEQSLSGRVEALDQSVAWLSPFVGTGTPKVFICPSTRNEVSKTRSINQYTGQSGLEYLQHFASTKNDRLGCSYMNHAFIGYNTGLNMDVDKGVYGRVSIPYLRKTLNNIQNYEKINSAFGGGMGGRTVGPSEFWLFVDNYWDGKILAFPDEDSNHGEVGVNVSYCDGHVDWVGKERFLEKYEIDTDEGRTSITLPY